MSEDAEALIAQLLHDRLAVMLAAVLHLAKGKMLEDQFVLFAAEARALLERASPFGGTDDGQAND